MATSFLDDHLTTLRSGDGHGKGAPPWTPAQRLLMAGSSLLYLGCAAAWARYGFRRLAGWFCLVSVLSCCGDAGGGLLPEWVMRRVRAADRAVGTVALLASVIFNATSVLNATLAVAAVLTSLLWLAKGRRVARAEPRARWRYLLFHGMWHAYGAAVLVAVTVRAQSGE
mmetsp:Transcript_15675/g.50230  ORF Transcript_15675/g.50230 Transcript_15675/m.50230 type:complete len:169 (-) Transcript_15675:61-567(-)|eukprot:CAMPEP_0185323328 /NCGR_PEP_ID=MMETSP1363-20130426/61519_1 /TAXON_ID=38817 /ORGANISM="Gephyrocapsa oceanica, Strain RCC1303" /LENGTH=168 /DNA_ID=CAMNT_0027921907 /DNA_START=54 /DNA_END=560 /DNA_ORIENTATION=+